MAAKWIETLSGTIIPYNKIKCVYVRFSKVRPDNFYSYCRIESVKNDCFESGKSEYYFCDFPDYIYFNDDGFDDDNDRIRFGISHGHHMNRIAIEMIEKSDKIIYDMHTSCTKGEIWQKFYEEIKESFKGMKK